MLKNMTAGTLILVLGLSACAENIQDQPIRGLDYVIKHENHSNLAVDNLQLVYAFDYWGSTGHAFQGPRGLFKNVLTPDSGRAATVKMNPQGSHWEASIHIPDSVALLSYYFTDGNNFDYNDKKTYTTYIYNKQGRPVRDARFRNIDFLIMAGESKKAELAEIEAEIADYPKNWLAQTVYWRKTFANAWFFRLDAALERANNEYDRLKQELGESDTLKNFKANYLLDYRNEMRSRDREKFESVTKEYLALMESIPPENRYGYAKRFYDGYTGFEEIRKSNIAFMSEIIGSAAPDFDYKTIAGNVGKLSDHKGNYLLIDFWGTWCKPCVAEIPDMKKAYDKYNPHGFEILSISSDQFEDQKLRDYVSEKEMNWQHVLDGQPGPIQQIYKIVSFPSLFLIDPEGKVVSISAELRGEQLDKKLEEVYSQ